jgi:hypothetical protein
MIFQFGFFSDLEGKYYSGTDNRWKKFLPPDTDTKLTSYLMSVPITNSPTERCLVYRMLLVGPVHFTVSYLTDFNDIYLAVPIDAHTSYDGQRFTLGYVSLPHLKEFKV